MPESRDPRFGELDALIAAEPPDARFARPGNKPPRPQLKPGPRPPCPYCRSAAHIHLRQPRRNQKYYCYTCGKVFTPNGLSRSEAGQASAEARRAKYGTAAPLRGDRLLYRGASANTDSK